MKSAPHKVINHGDERRWCVMSDDGKYRYRLDVTLSEHHAPRVVFIMLNPSTADHAQDDPTMRKCIGFAKRWGCGKLTVINVYAYRSTDPAELRRVARPVGYHNCSVIIEATQNADMVVVAWGANVTLQAGNHPYMNQDLITLQAVAHRDVRCLGYTKDGHPGHPLMLAYDTPDVEFKPRAWTEWKDNNYEMVGTHGRSAQPAEPDGRGKQHVPDRAPVQPARRADPQPRAAGKNGQRAAAAARARALLDEL